MAGNQRTTTKSRSRHHIDRRRISAMTALFIFFGFVALLAYGGLVSARDMRPQRRPPEWSVGRLIEPRR
jgi:hypothetical protein